jgi:hypothetical protein
VVPDVSKALLPEVFGSVGGTKKVVLLEVVLVATRKDDPATSVPTAIDVPLLRLSDASTG